MNKTGKYVKHGLTKSRVRNIWRWMMRRCYDPKTPRYDRWGGRGIKVCERWHDLQNFFADMGHPPVKHSIERINNDGDYEPGNCRWATQREQTHNTSRNRIIEIDGQRKRLSEWASIYGIKQPTLHRRLKDGWSVSDAVNKPVGRWHER